MLFTLSKMGRKPRLIPIGDKKYGLTYIREVDKANTAISLRLYLLGEQQKKKTSTRIN